MKPHARIRAAAVVFAIAFGFGGSGCFYPPTAPFAPWPVAYTPANPPPPLADKSRPPLTDKRVGTAPADVIPTQYQQPPIETKPYQDGSPVPGSQALHMPRVADLHMRTTPTMSGTALNLGPNEMPIDRAVELTRRLDAAAVENQVLASRIRTLEAKAEAREQAINESYRLVESSAMEVSRARSEVAVVKREIDALRERIRVMEQNEIETLKLVIAKLEQLLRQQE